MPNNVRIGTQVTGVGKASSDLDNLKDKFTKLQSQGAKGFAIGVAAGATGAALNLLSQAAGNAVGFLEDSAKAFNEEQASIQHLGTSLKANIPNWDGNTTAIEKVLKAQEKLGFTDDEQRDSLAKLVAATHDVTKAQEIQSVAMDLARFKGISLADATDALTKVEAGSYRILKSLGIELKNGATQADALAAVEGVAAGQAADFAQTNEGKLLVSQVKVNDAMEKFGSTVAPAQIVVTEQLANRTVDLANTLDILQHGFSKDSDAAREQEKSIFDLGQAVGVLFPMLGSLSKASADQVDAQQASADAYNANADAVHAMRVSEQADLTNAANSGEHFQRSVVGDMKAVSRSALDLASDYDKVQRRIRSQNAATVKQLDQDVQNLISDAFDPWMAQDKLLADNAEAAAQRRIIASKKATDAEKRDAYDALHSTERDAAEQLLVLAEAGNTTSTAYKQGVADLKTEIKNVSGPTKQYLQGILDKLHAIDSVNATPTVTIKFYGAKELDSVMKKLGYIGNTDIVKKGNTSVNKHARGGHAAAGEVALVGEEGPELVRFGSAANVTPAAQTAAALGGGGGGTINITVNAGVGSGLTPGDGRALAEQILPPLVAAMQRKGFLPRAGTGLRG